MRRELIRAEDVRGRADEAEEAERRLLLDVGSGVVREEHVADIAVQGLAQLEARDVGDGAQRERILPCNINGQS